MLSDFFLRALAAGTGLALVAGPFGCFMLWRRMAYFGDAITHSALLGVALALLFRVDILVGVLSIALVTSVALLVLQQKNIVPTDSLLGVLSHSMLALGLIVLGFMPTARLDIKGLLFGDLLAVSPGDIALIYGGGALVLGVTGRFWHRLVAASASTELARAEGMRPEQTRIILTLLLSLLVAMAMKIIGILLITGLLIIPAATARRLAETPEHMAMAASLVGVVSVIAGLLVSLYFDAPSGPAIIVTALCFFLASLFRTAPHDRANAGSRPATATTKVMHDEENG